MSRLFRLTGFFLLTLWSCCLHAQDRKSVSGRVFDATTKEPVPFAAVSLPTSLIGTNTNEQGWFTLSYPANTSDKRLSINCLGYKVQSLALDSVNGELMVFLEHAGFELREVVVRSLPPTHYISQAMKKLPENYPDAPFSTQAYYRQQVYENGDVLGRTEGVFQSYYPHYLDTAKHNQHQLILYRQADPHELQFMREKLDKERKKGERKAAKKNKDKPQALDDGITPGGDQSLVSFGGPEMILKTDFIRGEEPFLEEKQFKKFNYSFQGSTSYEGRQLMIIVFEAKEAVDHFRMNGKIYLDEESLAIVTIEYSAAIEIPLIAKPIMLLYGFSVDDAYFHKKLQYARIDGRWYPRDFQWEMQAHMEKRHLFDPNEQADFKMGQCLFVNQVELRSPQPILAASRFDSKKKMSMQVHPLGNLQWKDINQVAPAAK